MVSSTVSASSKLANQRLGVELRDHTILATSGLSTSSPATRFFLGTFWLFWVNKFVLVFQIIEDISYVLLRPYFYIATVKMIEYASDLGQQGPWHLWLSILLPRTSTRENSEEAESLKSNCRAASVYSSCNQLLTPQATHSVWHRYFCQDHSSKDSSKPVYHRYPATASLLTKSNGMRVEASRSKKQA